MLDVRFEVGMNNIAAGLLCEQGETAPLVLGEIVHFAAPETRQRLALTGFHEAEPTGRWTNGYKAALTVPLPGGAQEASSLRIRLTPLVTAHHGQTVRVHCGDRPEHVWTFPPGPMAETVVDLPVGDAAIGTRLYVTIMVENPIVPRVLGLSADPRLLGVLVHEISLGALPTESLLGSQAEEVVPSSCPSTAAMRLQGWINAIIDRVRALKADGMSPPVHRLSGKAWLKKRIRLVAHRLRAFIMTDLVAQRERLNHSVETLIKEQRGIGFQRS